MKKLHLPHNLSPVWLSLRCDGSVDRTQIDKIYVMAKAVSANGTADLFYLGAAEPEERGAKGLFNSVKNACSSTMRTSDANDAFLLLSSLVTDGANVNKGDKNGLWALVDRELRQSSETSRQMHPPLLKV